MHKASIAVLAVTLGLASTALVACGGDDDDEAAAPTTTAAPTGGGTTLKLSAPASGAFMFDKDALSAKAGLVTINFTNPASVSHDVVLEQDGNELAKSELISSGDSSTATATLKAGKYVYFCDVPGHRDGGMEGTLTVK
jgi:plastocyanin